MNGLQTPNESYSIGSTVVLTNSDNSGVTSWQWIILAKPTGSAATLSTPTSASASFTADVEGSWLIKLVTNGIAEDTAVARVKSIHKGLQLLSRDEVDEGDSSGDNGWARPGRESLLAVDKALGLTTKKTVRYTGGATTGPVLLQVSGSFALANGDIVPAAVLATVGTGYGALLFYDVSGALSANTTITAIEEGLTGLIVNPDTLVAQDKVYIHASTPGAVSKTQGSSDALLVGYCAEVSGGNVRLWFDPGQKVSAVTSAAGGTGAVQFANGTAFAADAPNLFYDDTNNRLGIGTNTPAFPLQVNGIIHSITGGFRFPDNTTQTTAATSTSAAGGTGAIQFANGTAFAADASNLFWDDTNNRLGIGTITPASQLHVVAETLVSDRGIITSQNSSDVGAALFQLRKSRGTSDSPTTVVNGDYLGFFGFRGHDGTAYRDIGGIGLRSTGAVGTNSIPNEMYFYTTTVHDDDPYLNGTVRMTISSTGNIGIGTTGPVRPLEVYGNNAGSVVRAKNTNSAGYSAMEFLNNAGASRLSVGYGNSGALAPWADANYLDAPVGDLIFTLNGLERVRYKNGGDVAFDTNTLYVDAANNRVGIKTIAPLVPLHVVGDVITTFTTGEIGFKTGLGPIDANNGQVTIRAAANDYLKLYGEGTTDNATLFIESGDQGDEPIVFAQNNTGTRTERLRVATDGLTLSRYDTSAIGPVFYSRKARGSQASPADLVNNDIMGHFVGQGYSGGTYFDTSQIKLEVDGNITSGQRPRSRITLYTNTTNQDPAEKWRLTGSGDIIQVGTGSSAGTPRSYIIGLSTGENAIFQLGESWNGMHRSFAGKLMMQATHGIEIGGSRNASPLVATAGAGTTDPSVIIHNPAGGGTGVALDVRGKTKIGDGTNTTTLGHGSFTPAGFGVTYPTNGAFQVVGGPTFTDGAAFQLFGGLEATLALPGQMYFDYGSSARNIAGRQAVWRNASLASGFQTVMVMDANSNIAFDTNTLFVDAVNNRVGINNAAPTVALDVVGAALISTDLTVNGNTVLGNASGDTLTFNASTVSVPNGLNFDTNTLVIDATNNRVGVAQASPTEALDVTGNARVTGKMLHTEGAAGSVGVATLVAGTVTVSTTAVTANSRIFLTRDTPGGVVGDLSAPTASITAATSFVINSDNVADTSTINWFLVN